jgi:hypothetical protein
MLRRIAFATSLAAALTLTGVAFAANGAGSNKTSTSSISPPIVLSAAAATAAPTAAPASTTAPRFGDTVTFDVSTTATTTPFVNLNCYQNGTLVAQGWATFFTGGAAGAFGLSSPIWKSGAADCTADLGMYSNNGKWKVLASTSFHVDG